MPGRDLFDAEVWTRSRSRSLARHQAAPQAIKIPGRSAGIAALLLLTGGPVAATAATNALGSDDPSPAPPRTNEAEAVPRVQHADAQSDVTPELPAKELESPTTSTAMTVSSDSGVVTPTAATTLQPPKPKVHHAAARRATRHRAAPQQHHVHLARFRGGGVRALQEALGLPADGVFGAGTERALERWQRRHGLSADGVAGPATRIRLGLGPGRALHRKRLSHRRHRHAGGGGGGGSSTVVARVIAAANRIATRPYVYGGGHGSFNSSGYDCSGSVSYALHGGGLLSSPITSGAFMSYGAPGPGRHISIYASSGHVYMTIDGRRFDTSARGQSGSRWGGTRATGGGYVVRHPPGY